MSLEDPQISLLSRLGLSPEERLLLLCARIHLDQGQRDALEALLESPIDWDQALHQARWQQLAPLMFHHLRGLPDGGRVPSEVMEQLRGFYQSNVLRSLHFHGELQTVLNALGARGISVILLKGAALSCTVYKDIGLRPMADLDLLVNEAQAQTTQDIIQGLGFSPIGTTDAYHQHLPALGREEALALVEVHRHIVRRDSGLYFDISGFWSRAQHVNIVKVPATVLAPEDLLIHLSLSFFQDRRFRSAAALRQLCDVAEVLKFHQDRIRWPLFLDNVRGYQLVGPVGFVLYLAQEVLGAPVDRRVMEELWPQGFDATRVERFLRRRVLDTQDWVAHSLVAPELEYKAGQMVRSAFRRLVPSRRYLAQRYHTSFSGLGGSLLYLLRLGDGLRILLRAVIRPGEMREDLALDRWHHSLYGDREGASAKVGGPDNGSS